MEIELSQNASKDLEYWRKSGNTNVQKKIKELLESIQEDPYNGIGKPEGLKYSLSGYWSRRINSEHRIIYEVVDDIVYIESFRGHYNS